MRKNFRVIQINGFRGILVALAILACLIAGFVVFPGYVAMELWNFVSVKTMLVPQLALMQGVLLWGIMVVSYMIIKKRSVIVSFKQPTELSEAELDEVMEHIKMETTARMMSDVIAKSRMEKKPTILDVQSSEVESKEEVGTSNKNIDN